MENRVDIINREIQSSKIDTNLVSDGFHTFGELYKHRCTLFIALCRAIEGQENDGWRSRAHSDGSVWENWFILGIGKEKGEQITYHLPMSMWHDTNFVETLVKAPDWDGHTSEQVLERLNNLFWKTSKTGQV